MAVSKRGSRRGTKSGARGRKTRGRKTAAKRTVVTPKGNKRYVRRDSRGRIQESDSMGRSLSQDRRRRSKRTAKRGQGDRGDRAR